MASFNGLDNSSFNNTSNVETDDNYYDGYTNDDSVNFSNQGDKKKKIVLIVAILILLILGGILIFLLTKDNNSEDPTPSKIVLNVLETEVSLFVGDTHTITVNVIGDDDVKDKVYTFTSADDKILTVTDKGVVKALKEGSVTVTIDYVANDGNKYSKSCLFTITKKQEEKPPVEKDKEKPVIKYTIIGAENNKWTSGNVSVKVSVTDNKEVSSIKYSINCKENCNYVTIKNNSQITFGDSMLSSGMGQFTVYLFAKDKAGNESVESFTIKIDKVSPTCNFSQGDDISKGLDSGASATINLTCTENNELSDDDISISDLYASSNISITNITKKKVSNSYQYTITIKGNSAGKTQISLKAGAISDIANNGNSSVSSQTIASCSEWTREYAKYVDSKSSCNTSSTGQYVVDKINCTQALIYNFKKTYTCISSSGVKNYPSYTSSYIYSTKKTAESACDAYKTCANGTYGGGGSCTYASKTRYWLEKFVRNCG